MLSLTAPPAFCSYWRRAPVQFMIWWREEKWLKKREAAGPVLCPHRNLVTRSGSPRESATRWKSSDDANEAETQLISNQLWLELVVLADKAARVENGSIWVSDKAPIDRASPLALPRGAPPSLSLSRLLGLGRSRRTTALARSTCDCEAATSSWQASSILLPLLRPFLCRIRMGLRYFGENDGDGWTNKTNIDRPWNRNNSLIAKSR